MNDSLQSIASRGEKEFASEKAVQQALGKAESLTPLPEVDLILPHLPQKGMTVALHRLLARSLEEAGREDEADLILFALAERLNQAGLWGGLATVAGLLLDRAPHQAAPLIARARAQGGALAVKNDLLWRAHDAHPGHGILAWQSAEAFLEDGNRDQALQTAARALPRLIDEKNYETSEMALLLLSEAEEALPVPPICRALELLARQEAWEPMMTMLDLMGEHIVSEEGASLAWPTLREVWRKHPDEDGLRPWVVRLAREYLERYPEPKTMLRVSEVERPSQGPAVILDRLACLEKFPPGYYARHSGWGIGKIRENDTEVLIIDFPEKPMHRMTVNTADLALDGLAPGHLEVLLIQDPEALKSMAKKDPSTLVLKALECLIDGKGTGDLIRKILVPRILTSASWAAWWKGVQEALLADDRIDTKNAYQNEFRIRQPGDALEETPLPDWNHKKDVLKNLTVLENFLTQNPGERKRLLEGFADRLNQLAEGPKTNPAEKVAVELWLNRVDPGISRTPERHMKRGFDINALAKRDQEQLLDSLSDPRYRIPILGSRLMGIRKAAWQGLQDAGLGDATLVEVLEEPTRHAEATLFFLEQESAPAIALLGSAKVFLALLEVLERPPRDSHRKRALGILEKDTPFETQVQSAPISEEAARDLVHRLERWQSSDRFRFPVLEFLRRTGHAPISDAVENARARQAARISERMDAEPEDPYAGSTLLTRPTLDRLEAERHRVGMELKTSIPKIIQKAREHGDLKENAEYDAAKAKQASYAKRFEELEGMIREVRLIEDLPREPGVVAPGTEVELIAVEGDTKPERLWILGEGDQDLGDGVVSYQAPLGQALAGLREEDEVSLSRGEEPIRYRILRVRERLP